MGGLGLKYKLEELVTIKYGKNQKKVKDENGIYPILGTGGRMGWANDFLYDKPSVLIPRKGSISRVMYIDEPFWTVDTLFYTIVKEKLVIPKYLYYNLSLIDFIHYNEGTTIPSLRTETLNKIEINIQPLNVQKQIVKILDCLENKININKKINTTLEEIAQAIFKHWFVDFEFPNENGEPYKSSGGKFVESELGMIPEGWGVKSLDQIAHYKNGLAMQKYRPLDGEESLPVLKIKELNQGFTDENSDRCSCKIDEEVKVYDGDIIFSWSGTLLVKIWMGGNAGLNQHLFKVTSEIYPKWFYYYWTKFYLDRFIRIAADRATTMGHIKRSHLKESLVAVPPKELINEFNNIFEPIIKKIVNTGIESRYLGELRDTLLPKLMSGEIRVPEAEEVVESCLQKNN